MHQPAPRVSSQACTRACSPAPHNGAARPFAEFLQWFIQALQDMGPAGYVAYAAVYAGLELLAVPGVCVVGVWWER